MILDKFNWIFLVSILALHQTLGFLVIRPFIHTNMSIYHPKHNFWPWIPVSNSDYAYRDINITASNHTVTDIIVTSQAPTTKPVPSVHTPLHHFWPFIPVEEPQEVKVTAKNDYFQLPKHNFWPFVPIFDVTLVVEPPTLPKQPWPPSTNRYNYGDIMYKSMLFFEAQRSGWLPHDKRVAWRGHSATEDKGYYGEDLTGGWYDSGDYIKFGLPMAAATSMLLWGLVDYADAYKSLGLLDDIHDCVRWPLDYFLKAHTERFVFYGQVGNPYVDHAYWGRPEDMDMNRPAYKLTPESPGSDLVAETAAAMAAGYLAFRDIEPGYAKKLLEHAHELFEFAENFRGRYSDTIDNAVEFYGSANDEDELAWAAAWLYRATKNRFYLTRAQHWYRLSPTCWAQSWADKTCGVSVLLYKLTKENRYKSITEEIFSEWLPGGGIHYTPKGLAFKSEWGTLRYTADLNIQSTTYRRWARQQIHYMLGDSGRSYVIGYGHDPPTRPHHASSSCRSSPHPCTWADYTKPEPNAHVLFGALVGGPSSDDSYLDERDDYIHNEVGCEYNGGFQSAIAALKLLELQMT